MFENSTNDPASENDPGDREATLVGVVIPVALVGTVIGLIGVLIAYFAGRDSSRDTKESAEHAIGSFQFVLGGDLAPARTLPEGRLRVIEFEAVAVLGGQGAEQDAWMRRHRSRIHEAVESVARSATDEELGDRNLVSLRKRMRRRLNRVLGNNYVREVLLSHFRTFDSPKRAEPLE